MRKIICILAILSALLHAAESRDTNQSNDSNGSTFIDPEDGYLDMSRFLASKKGFLPVPIIITGPTFGLGGGLNVMFLSDTLTSKKRKDGKYVPPEITGVAAAGTENGSRFAAGYYMGYWLEGDLRTTTFVGRPDANMDFGSQIGSVSLNTLGYAFYQEVKYRILDTALFLGANYTYMHIKTSPNDLPDPADDFIGKLLNEHTYAGLAAVAEYDSRDSIFTPSRGVYAKAVLDFYNSAFGSDKNFNKFRTKVFYFQPLREGIVIGLRAEYQSILGGDRPPAAMLPSIVLRGLPSYEYVGQNAVIGEVEARYEVVHRSWLVGFSGTGKAFGSYSSDGDVSFADAPAPVTYGIGYRYDIAKKFKMLAGFDVARSGSDNSFYITVGNAWNAFF